jgi:hypothetical protein
MRTITTYEKEAIQVLNNIPCFILAGASEIEPIRYDINNGVITGATVVRLDYVSFHDGRNIYCDKPVKSVKLKALLNAVYGMGCC